MIIFVRTKNSTVELAEKLEARGYAATALNGDIAQNQRERTIKNLKAGTLDILVATDVAARGLDVDRISHVVNYDVPYDTEAYVHRIGRTGRAGREGDAILFVAPREKRMLNAIERATRKKIEIMELPSTEFINDKRIGKFKQSISDTLANEDLSMFSQLIEQYQQEHNIPALEIAAALARQLQGDADFLLTNKPKRKAQSRDDWDSEDRSRDSGRDRSRREQPARDRTERSPRERSPERKRQPGDSPPDEGMERFRIEVGHNHQVKPGNIVGAIANEADIESKYIGRINIYDDYSTVDLPEGMPKELLYTLKKVWVAGQQLKISHNSKQAGTAKSAVRKVVNQEPDKRPRAPVKSNVKERGDVEGKRKKLTIKKGRKK
jgi:ATP-dependent RNA helicase DeaD